MREFLKVGCVLVIAAGIITAVIAWVTDRPDQVTWILRTVPVALAVAALGFFLRMHFQKDRATDHLYLNCGKYFDRGGFCFPIGASVINNACSIDVYFQNQYERPCIGRVALRQTKGYFGPKQMDSILVDIECEGGAFGVARTPIPILFPMQGHVVKFTLGASSSYPGGRGRLLRFRNGMPIRSNMQFQNPFGTALTVAGAMGGAIVINRPASVTLTFPRNVAAFFKTETTTQTTILARLDDDPAVELKN